MEGEGEFRIEVEYGADLGGRQDDVYDYLMRS